MAIMGIQERRERDKTELRAKILEAAKELFVTEGYEKTSLRNIAEKIEYSPATIYLYFKDKVQILQEVCLSGFDALFDEFEGAQIEPDPMKRLRLMGHRYFHFAKSNAEMYDLMFILHEPMDALEAEERWQEGFKTFFFVRDTVASAIEVGQIRAADPDITAVSLWAFVHGLSSLYVRDRFKMLPADHIEPIIHRCIDQMMDNYALPPS